MISTVFIDRPRLAGMIPIVVFLAGLIALGRLPVEQYPDIATVNVQNRVALAEPLLPAEVTHLGVKVAKQSSSLLMGVALATEDGSIDGATLTNLARIYLIDRIKRVPGVGDARPFAQNDFPMRINLDVDRLTQLDLGPNDIINALRTQNARLQLGARGGQPLTDDPGF